MKTALVHDWLTGMRGGEKCLEIFCELFPEADLFTLIHVPGNLSPSIEKMSIKTSFLQRFPGIESNYRYFLPIMPWAIRHFDLRDYDLVLSSSHCVAKGIRTSPDKVHICYCFTPMRYIWDQYDQYFNPHKANPLIAAAMRFLRPWLQTWDVTSNREVTDFVAISHHVRKRIQNFYNLSAEVIYPPVDTDFYSPTGEPSEDFFLMVSAFAPYKRLDLAVEAFNELGYPLKIIGEGQESKSLQQKASNNIEFLGWLSDEEIRSHYARCRAFIFPGEEDFGITPLEAQAMGRPVIAYSQGGVLETVIPSRDTWLPEFDISIEKTAQPSGVFFHDANSEALQSAVRYFESIESQFDPVLIRRHAVAFDRNVFTERIHNFILNRTSKC